jgi:murein tripeptide amidase MpaA
MLKTLFVLLPQLLILLILTFQTGSAFLRPEKALENDIVKVRVTPDSQDQIEILKQLEPYHLSEIPASRLKRSYDYELPRGEIALLESATIPFVSMARDTNFWTEEYYSYQEVYNIFTTISINFPNIASMESLGVSTRDSVTIWGLKISDNPEQQEDEIDVLIDAVIHAREPVNTNVCMALVDTLITSYGIDSAITNLIDDTELWVVPIKNPEGYLYVQTGIENPWWRKNKRDNNNNGIFDGIVPEWCDDYYPSMPDGVDLNRNYVEGWEIAGHPEPCHIVYRGPAPFSENESQMERDLVGREAIVAGICFHSYSEYVGYCGYDPAGLDLCEDMAESITRENGYSSYDCNAPFYGAGQSYNWMYWEYGMQGYLIETATEFMPSGPNRINQIVQENVDGIFTLLNRVHGSSIVGHVYDSETLEPLVAEVSIVGEYPINQPRRSEPHYGRFYKMVRGPESYVLNVRKDGYEDYTDPAVIVEDGSPTYIDVPLVPSPVDIGDDNPGGLINVRAFSISQNYPNPFNPSTTLQYSIPRNAESVDVDVAIYDVRGRMVRRLVDEVKDGGVHMVHWDGRDGKNEPVPSGIYLYRIRAGEFRDTRKMVLTR